MSHRRDSRSPFVLRIVDAYAGLRACCLSITSIVVPMLLWSGTANSFCTLLGDVYTCTGPATYINSAEMARENPPNGVQEFRLDGTLGAIEVQRTGANNSGVSLSSDGSWLDESQVVTSGEVSIETTGANNARGISVRTSSQLGGITVTTSSDTSITTSGAGATGRNHGIFAFNDALNQGTGAIVVSNQGRIITRGQSSYGVYGLQYALADLELLSSGTIETSEIRSHGLHARHQGAYQNPAGRVRLALTGSAQVRTQGDGAVGLYGRVNQSTNQAQIDIEAQSATRITTSGNEIGSGAELVAGYGIYAQHQGRGAVRIHSAGMIDTSGSAAHGVFAWSSRNNNESDQEVVVAGGQVLTTGDGAHGVYLRHDGTGENRVSIDADVSARGAAVRTETPSGGMSIMNIGDGASLGSTAGLAIVNNEGDSVTTISAGAAISGAIELGDGTDSLIIDGASLENITILDGGDDVAIDDGWIDELSLINVDEVVEGDRLVNWERIRVGTGTSLELFGADLVTGSGLDGDGLPLGLHVLAGGTLRLGSTTFTVQGDARNAGVIDLRGASPGNVLTVDGNYHGDGGLLRINTVLAGDNSASDRLLVTGDTSGSTTVQVSNAGGTGAQTINGIRVVEVAGTSGAGDFSLTSPVQAGAYEYDLIRRADSDFYLVSEYTMTPPSEDPELSSPTPPSVPRPKAPVAAPQVLRPAVAGYVMGQLASHEISHGLIGRLRQRVGEQGVVTECYTDVAELQPEAWGRVHGQRVSVDGGRQFVLDQDLAMVQFGKDLFVSGGSSRDCLSRTHAGVTLGFGHTDADFEDGMRSTVQGRATGVMEGRLVTFGGYRTRYSADGRYVDLLGQLQVARNEFGDIRGIQGTQDGRGVALSVEYGRGRGLGDTDLWSLEPQAQLNLSYMSYSAFADPVSTIGGFDSRSLRARLGVRLARDGADRVDDTAVDSNMAERSTRTRRLVLTADVMHDFLGPDTVRVANIGVSERLSRSTWLELGIAGQVGWGTSVKVFGGAQFQRSLGASGRDAMITQFGVRWHW